ncbi:MAG: alpha-L-rhamnosidase N-terminal domain-containing protein, partial [Bacteroidales bacterium]|nr:alpha-L-rhamnosidase N-terminal domain-containing protein [Bacteroidales bacterium]
MRCEYLTEPQGIDNPYSLEQMTEWDYSPRLSWMIKTNNRLVRKYAFDTTRAKWRESIRKFKWRLDRYEVEPSNRKKLSAYRVIVALSEKDLKKGKNLLWDSKIVETTERFCFLPKEIMRSHTKYYWRVQTFIRRDYVDILNDLKDIHDTIIESKISNFSTGLLAQDWKGQFIKHPTAEPEQHISFKKDFDLPAATASNLKHNPVFVYVASLGYHELYINGERVGENVLSPAVSRLDKRILYITYDISKYLKKGKNTIKVHYGAGWTLNDYFSYYGVKQGILVQVYGANNFELHSDTTWLCAESNSRNIGHFKFMDMGGELVDKRRTSNRQKWIAAAQTNLPTKPVLSAQMTDFSKVIEEISAKEIMEIPDGKGGIIYRADMGKEFTGFLKVTFDGLHCGDTVIMQISMRDSTRRDVARGVSTMQATDTVGDYIIEEQNQKQIYIANCCDCTDECDNKRAIGSKTFCNQFNYFAGRYIHFRLKPDADTKFITRKNIKGLVVSSAPEYTAKFTGSNPLYNAIFEMDKYSFQMNHTEGVTTDCPNRERLGYGPEGAYQTAWGLALPCFNSAAYFVKNVRDWADVQRSDGSINNVAPQISDM